jgi:hypothetical protein
MKRTGHMPDSISLGSLLAANRDHRPEDKEMLEEVIVITASFT